MDLNGKNGPRDNKARFGPAHARGVLWVVDMLVTAGCDGPVHFDCKAPRTDDDEGVWAWAAAWMRDYLIQRRRCATSASPRTGSGAVAWATSGWTSS